MRNKQAMFYSGMHLIAMSDEGYPLCNVYKEKVLPDENGLCSLCSMHSASVTRNNRYATLSELKITNEIPF